MNNKSPDLEIIDGIFDIEPLLEPALSNFELTLYSLLFLLTLCISLYALWITIYSRKGKAKRRLKSLLVDYDNGLISGNDVVYKASSFLINGLNLNNIIITTPLPKQLNALTPEWEGFKSNLSYFRYSKNETSALEVRKLFSECFYWLKKWP